MDEPGVAGVSAPGVTIGRGISVEPHSSDDEGQNIFVDADNDTLAINNRLLDKVYHKYILDIYHEAPVLLT